MAILILFMEVNGLLEPVFPRISLILNITIWY